MMLFSTFSDSELFRGRLCGRQLHSRRSLQVTITDYYQRAICYFSGKTVVISLHLKLMLVIHGTSICHKANILVFVCLIPVSFNYLQNMGRDVVVVYSLSRV